MDRSHVTLRIPRRWAKVGLVALVTALIIAPATAIASHSFTDVPDTNTFHADIEWLKDAGVTLGCNPPDNTNYCPDDNVTRGQMAAFMHRLADNQVVDADKVDGMDASDFLGASGKAADSELLDGNEPSQLSVQGWSIVESDSVTLGALDSVETATASCPEGTNVIGGGWSQSDGTFQINYLSNRPNSDGTAWEITGQNAGLNTDRSFRAFAICAVVNP